MSVQRIKDAIQRLTLEERAAVAACLHDWKDDEWDQQMKRDFAAGKFNKLLHELDADTSS